MTVSTASATQEQIRFRCPNCAQSYRAPTSFSGRQVTCAQCKIPIKLGGHQSAPTLELASIPHAPESDLDLLPTAPRNTVADAPSEAELKRQRRRRIRRRERNDPNMLRQLDDAAGSALMWGVLSWFVFFFAFFAIKKANDARYIARRMGVPTPDKATAGLWLGWIVAINVLIVLTVIIGGVALMALGLYT